MGIKIQIRLILLLLVLATCAIARYDIINKDELCTAARFIYVEDDARQEKFNVDPMNINGEHRYHQHTVAINAKITKGVNTKRKATMDTKQAVVLAILGTAFTETGENTDITRKFWATRKKIKTSSPDIYRTDITYLHYAALHTIETLANHLVRDALGLASRLIEEKQEIFFGNLSFLTGIDRDTFIELFGLARGAHQVGVDIRKGIAVSASEVSTTAIATVEVVLERTLSNHSESPELKAVLSPSAVATINPTVSAVHGDDGHNASSKETTLVQKDEKKADEDERDVSDVTLPSVNLLSAHPLITSTSLAISSLPSDAPGDFAATIVSQAKDVTKESSTPIKAAATVAPDLSWTKTYSLKGGKKTIIRTEGKITYTYPGRIIGTSTEESNKSGVLIVKKSHGDFTLSLTQSEEGFEALIKEIDPTFGNSTASTPTRLKKRNSYSWGKTPDGNA